MPDRLRGSIRHNAQAYLSRTTVIGPAMPEPYWLFVLIYLTAGWVGGILTQAVVGEAVDRRAIRRLTEIRELLAAEYGDRRDVKADIPSRVPAAPTRTHLAQAAHTRAPASSA